MALKNQAYGVQYTMIKWELTGTSCVYSNVYNLGNICCIRYHTVVDPILSTSPPLQEYNHPTSGSVEVPL